MWFHSSLNLLLFGAYTSLSLTFLAIVSSQPACLTHSVVLAGILASSTPWNLSSIPNVLKSHLSDSDLLCQVL